MSDTQTNPAFKGVTRSAVAEHARAISSACGEQLSELLGATLTARASEAQPVRKGAVADDDSPLLHQLFKTGVGGSQPIHVLASRESAATLVGLQLGKSPEEIEQLRKQEIDTDGCSAFQSLMSAVTGPVSQSLGAAGLGSIEVRDAREIPEPASDPTWLDGDEFVRLRIELSLEGHPDLRLDVLFPRAAGDADETDFGDVRLIFVECCPDEFDRLDEIAADAPFSMVVMQPQAFLEELDDAAEATAIVIPSDLAGRSGIEMLEALIADERLANVRFVMSSNAPTRHQISAARRAGALSFLRRPYERSEIERRLVEPAAADTQESGSTED